MTEEEIRLHALGCKQVDRLTQLRNELTNFKKDGVTRKTRQHFEVRLARITETREKFLNDHEELIQISGASTDIYTTDEIFQHFEDTYIDVVAYIQADYDQRFPSTATSAQPNLSLNQSMIGHTNEIEPRLPQLDLPTFSGQYVEWPSFADRFVSSVHNHRNITDVNKLIYLKSALTGNALMVINGFACKGQNYAAAWRALKEKYENHRAIFHNALNSVLSIAPMKKESAEIYSSMLGTTDAALLSLEQIGEDRIHHGKWFAFILRSRLPGEILYSLDQRLGGNEVIKYDDLKECINAKIRILEEVNQTPCTEHFGGQSKAPHTTQRNHRNERKSYHTTAKPIVKSEACRLCNGDHILRKCPTFLGKSCFERKDIVNRLKLCINCLSSSHFVSKCPSKTNCLSCNQRHHTLLHFPINENASTSNVSPSASNVSPITSSTTNVAAHATNIAAPLLPGEKRALLSTALIPVTNPRTGKSLTLRALLDSESEGTFITTHAARALGLKGSPMLTDVTGVGDKNGSISKEYVSFMLKSHLHTNFEVFIEQAFVIDVVTGDLPSRRIERTNWPHISGLVLADPEYFRTRKIDLLIGTLFGPALLLPEQRIGQVNHPIAQNSYFGWILNGPAGSITPPLNVRCHHIAVSNQLDNVVQRFFESEQVPEDRSQSEEEKWFIDFFHKTTTRQANGKYMVRLPLKTIYDPNQTIGRSKQMALCRFHQLERRLKRNEGYLERYASGIQEYFDLNQIIIAPDSEDEHVTRTESHKQHITSCVLAHHAVIKEDSLTTQLRIVFDASAKTSNGKSLNDILVTGPVMQNELPAVIMNWRRHRYVFTADIKKMYRCIDMHPDDISYQRILWRNEIDEVREYCLTTVTFGTGSAPCTAILIIHKIADDEKHKFPLAEEVLKKDMYVDDVQTGSDTIENAVQIRNHVIGALQSAGMELRKWSSNASAVLNSIPLEHQCSSTSLELNSNETVKTLGMFWQPNEDVFKFKIKFELPTVVTKRTVLSTTARLFDPLGFVTPIIVVAKAILKSIWNHKCKDKDEITTSLGWDDPIPEHIHAKWVQYLSELPIIEQISIPRWFNYLPRHIASVELHAFCDGSTLAYAANVYIRIKHSDGMVYTHLLIAKSKVTPTNPLTIPRVELCGAELAARLANWVKRTLRINEKDIPIHFWSDATIVLYWIHGDISRWKTYVSNRVSKILTLSSPLAWNHVDTKENPADCATRGLTPAQLAHFDLWWKGPDWLKHPPSQWPKFNTKEIAFDDTTAEAKTNKVHVHSTIQTGSILFKYSSYNMLIRIAAWILRYKHNLRKVNHSNRRTGPLTVIELQESLLAVVRLVQAEAFGQEIHLIRDKEPLPSKSKIRGLAPFIDATQILRVGGRLQRSQLSYGRKHPMIVPAKHHFTRLLIDDSHRMTLHGGVKVTLNRIRHQFWITNANQVVGHQLRKCIKCFRQKPEIASQMMGNLPYHRVNPPTRAFLVTGVDYTGAIELKSSRFRGNTTYKGYIAVFVCMATKAIHLEAVTGLSTEHFMMALHRFIGRRGLCKDMYSDNGTNFIGADNVINSRKDIERDIVPKLSERGIQWHFTPPYSPNFGGLWEANVKSTKYHLKRIVDGTRLTYEELATLLVRIESCLNSRPLCPLTADLDDLDVLTPGHFLIGDALLAPPSENVNVKLTFSDNYVALQKMVQSFWAKWSSDWLSHMQMRPKWHAQKSNLEVNDLILVKDDNLPPNKWIIGRVIEVHPGPDTLVRVATVKTRDGIYKRSISKLCRLPIHNQSSTIGREEANTNSK